jgi:sarcosine oxidase subunit alpha
MTRLPHSPTHRINPDRKLTFRWGRRRLEGCEGDTVASALWAAGIRVMGRSFEYHRPRGLYDLDGEGASQLVGINGVPNQSAGTTLLGNRMSIVAQNVKGDPESDRWGFIDLFDRLMPAGFYYGLFHRPAWAWPFFQNRMRAMAGLGVLDVAAPYDDTKRSEIHLNAEVAVVGGGPAGMSAALAAAREGVRVVLFERRHWLGGHLDWRIRERDGLPLHERARRLADRVEAHPGIRVFRAAPVTGIWGENLVTGFQKGEPGDGFDERHWECRANTVVVATGVIERPLVFSHNDRPGVMQSDTAWRLARTYGVQRRKAAVFSVGDDLGLEAALDLAGLGLRVRVVADARTDGHDPELVRRLHDANIPFLPGHAASRAMGRKWVTGVEIASLPIDAGEHHGKSESAQRAEDRRVRYFACDLLVANAGRQPDIGVLSTSGARFTHSSLTHTFELEHLPHGVFAAGGALGLTDVDSIEASGQVAGLEALQALDAEKVPHTIGQDVARELTEAQGRVDGLPGPPPGCGVLHGPHLGLGRKAFLDFDEDGTWKNAVQCAAKGFDAPELSKRFGNFGLGPGQYRVPGQNVAMAMAKIGGQPMDDIASTTVRPPVVAPNLATLAGPTHDVFKRTPLHDEQSAEGGIFRRAGDWERARYFSENFTCRDEIKNVRTNVGLLDSSPLGKFRIWGPDAMQALQRVYASNMTKAKPGRCKYSAMCNDTGNIVDDGVVVPVGENDFYFTTSSARAEATVEWFRFHTRYDGWDFNLVNLTDTLTSINIAGPNARAVLAKVTDADVSHEAFPYMGYREIHVCEGVPARCLRLGFVGELSYELHLGSSYAPYVWDRLSEAGHKFGIQPFGLEAQYCMRAEKGHLIIGAESEQRVTLLDIEMGWMWDRKDTTSKKVGAPALRACADQPGRMKLVGFRVDDPAASPQDGAIVVDGEGIVGFVCTTRKSEALGWQFGMALVQDEFAALDGTIQIYENFGGKPAHCAATVVSPTFYDPEGKRLRS